MEAGKIFGEMTTGVEKNMRGVKKGRKVFKRKSLRIVKKLNFYKNYYFFIKNVIIFKEAQNFCVKKK